MLLMMCNSNRSGIIEIINLNFLLTNLSFWTIQVFTWKCSVSVLGNSNSFSQICLYNVGFLPSRHKM